MALGSTQPLRETSTEIFLGVTGDRPVRKADNLTTICEPMSRKCGSLDVSQTNGPPWPVTGIYLLLYVISTSISKEPPPRNENL
jgi:hypothetical protein